jgi:uncharacterized damage-inducible protein DinB
MEIKREVLEPVPGLSGEIGLYYAGMREIREQVREMIVDLTPAEIAARPIPEFNCIGALLLHVAENDFCWIQSLLGRVVLTEEVKSQIYWDILDEENFAVRGYTAEFCLEEMERISGGSKATLEKFRDEDMEKLFMFPSEDAETEFSMRWVLHHLIDHEAHHKGQIALIKKLIRKGA